MQKQFVLMLIIMAANFAHGACIVNRQDGIVGKQLLEKTTLVEALTSELKEAMAMEALRRARPCSREVRVLQGFFKCAQQDNLPVFARAGFLLGVIRSEGFIHFEGHVDHDADVGYLNEDHDAVYNYFQTTSPCLRAAGIHVSEAGVDYTLNACVEPPLDVINNIGTIPDTQLHEYCEKQSPNHGFNVHLTGSGDDSGVDSASLSLAAMAKTKDGRYFYAQPCIQKWNCPIELRSWYTIYGKNATGNVGQMVASYYDADTFKPLTTHPFYGAPISVPQRSEHYLESRYGLNWRQPVDKKQGDHDQAAVTQPAPCS